jgi:hypothetical protein
MDYFSMFPRPLLHNPHHLPLSEQQQQQNAAATAAATAALLARLTGGGGGLAARPAHPLWGKLPPALLPHPHPAHPSLSQLLGLPPFPQQQQQHHQFSPPPHHHHSFLQNSFHGGSGGNRGDGADSPIDGEISYLFCKILSVCFSYLLKLVSYIINVS